MGELTRADEDAFRQWMRDTYGLFGTARFQLLTQADIVASEPYKYWVANIKSGIADRAAQPATTTPFQFQPTQIAAREAGLERTQDVDSLRSAIDVGRERLGLPPRLPREGETAEQLRQELTLIEGELIGLPSGGISACVNSWNLAVPNNP